MQIIVQDVQTTINTKILNLLANSISSEFPGYDVNIASKLEINMENFIGKNRNQARFPDLLTWVLNKIRSTTKIK